MLNVEIGKGLTVAIETDKLQMQPNAWEHIIKIGLRNILMDSHANVKRDDHESDAAYRDASLAQAMKKLDALMRGEVRSNGTRRVSAVDPVTAEAMRMARVFVGQRLKGWQNGDEAALALIGQFANAKAMRCGTTEDDKAVVAAMIEARAAREDVREAAAAVVAQQSKIKVDLSDF